MSHMRYYWTVLQQYKGYTLKPAYQTEVDYVSRWVDDVPNGASLQLQMMLAAKHSVVFLAIKLSAS